MRFTHSMLTTFKNIGTIGKTGLLLLLLPWEYSLAAINVLVLR